MTDSAGNTRLAARLPHRGALADWLSRRAGWIRWLAIVLLVLAVVVFMSALPIGAALVAVEGWIRGFGAWGLLAFALLYAVATVALVPGLVLTVAAGAIFGSLWGGWGLLWATLAVSLGSNLGAAAALLIGRYVMRERVRRWVQRHPRFEAVDRAIATGGWKIVALLRLSPAIPFNLQNYLYGLTPIPFWTAVGTSIVAMLPGTFLYVYLGHVLGLAVFVAADTERQTTIAEWVMLGLGLAATVAVTVYLTHLAQRILREQTAIEPADEQQHAQSAREDSASDPAHRGSPRHALILLLIAVLALAGACTVRLGGLLNGLFGPPPATLAEAYERQADGPVFDHSRLDALLREHVSKEGGWVDYAGLARDAEALDQYIAHIAAAPFNEMGRDQKLALLINGYNAFTLKLILEHYELVKDHPEGIKAIPAGQRWDDQRWRVGEHTWSLNQIEHEQIRPKFKEPRIHFALVCAAVGCPPLRNEAYMADRLEAQLEDQAVYVHQQDRWFRYDGGDTVHLTALYNWYGGDFEQVAGSVLEYAADYAPALRTALDEGRTPTIRWLPYDWALNSQERAP